MKAIGRTQSLVIAVVLAVAVLAGGFFGLVKPEKKKVSDLKTQAQTQESANSTLALQLSVLKDLAKKLPAEQAELAKIKTKVPDQVQLANLLRQLVVAGANSGITITGLTPAQPVELTGAPGISYVDLTITFTGGYAEVEQFDSALEGLARTLLVKDFSLTGGASGSSSVPSTTSSTATASSNIITAIFNGRVLVRDSTPAATPTPAATTAAK